MKARFHIAECSLSYAKIMQTSAMKARFHIAECSLSYAKVMYSFLKKEENVGIFTVAGCLAHPKSHVLQHPNPHFCKSLTASCLQKWPIYGS